jgi:hypothetical protein
MFRRMKHVDDGGMVRLALEGDAPALRRIAPGSRMDRGLTILLQHLRRLAEQINDHLVDLFDRAGYGVPWTVQPLTSTARAAALARSLRGTLVSEGHLASAVAAGAEAIEVIVAAVGGVNDPSAHELAMLAIATSGSAGVHDPVAELQAALQAEIAGAEPLPGAGTIDSGPPSETARLDELAFLRARLDDAEAALAVIDRKLQAAADAWTGPGIMRDTFLDFRASAPEVEAEVHARAGTVCPKCRRKLITQAMLDEGTAGKLGNDYDVRSNIALCWATGGPRCAGWVRLATAVESKEAAMKRTE